MIDDLLEEISERGQELHYLRGSITWEALVRHRLHTKPLRYAIGFGRAGDPYIALQSALDNLEYDPGYETITLQQPTCEPKPEDDLSSILSTNLRSTFPFKVRL